MKRTLIGLLAVFIGVLFIPVAQAADQCTTFTNHSGSVPGSYDYAVFTEVDPAVSLTVETNGQNTLVDPQQYGAGNSWDTVQKCHRETTTTTEATTSTTEQETSTTSSSTTTTAPETTTSTEDVSTTTTVSESTTTRSDCETLFEDECFPTTTDPVTPTTPPESDSTLPFTGVSRMTAYTMIFVAAVSAILGFVMVKEANR